MSDIATWLEEIGLGKYTTTFVENEIDVDILAELSELDLEKLGIPMGPRKRLLKAVQTLSTSTGAVVVSESPANAPPATASQAERRQLTVMFVDLVGSTALSGQFDPEDLSVIMRDYQNTVSGEINRLEGFVAKFMGDGVLAYFGWPRAHEDEAERAVRAALAIIDEVARLRTPDEQPLSARIGIATGQVVVGDLIGEGVAQEETVVGETPNIAARLQALAEPGNIMISDSTRHLCGEVFELEHLGAQQLKGVADAVDTFKVCGERVADSRYQAQRAGELLPLIGREHELAQIMARWQQAQSGEGQMILLSGEAGIGKSRLLRAVVDAIADQPHYRINNQCSPYHSDSALYPVIQQIMRACEFATADDTDTRLDKLEALLGLALAEPRQRAPLFAALLNIDATVRYGALELSSQQQRTQTLHVLIEQLNGLARQRPLLWIIEDAHWIDPTTLELIELALNSISQSRLLLLITARPTFEHHLGGHPIATRIMLNHLGRESSHAIIERICAGKALPQEVLDEIIRKTDGVPLFVEEFTKTILESGQLRETSTAYLLDQPIASIDIPSSLHDSLMARLDRLQPIREIAQTAACIGREFSYQLLSVVIILDDEELQSALEQLTEAELVFQRGTPPESTYIFKHALVQDTAYTSLLKSRRQQIHATIAQTLRERFAYQIETEPELLAFHYTYAGLAELALRAWQVAARLALARSAYVEALSHLDQALAQLEDLPEDEDREQLELELLVMKFGPLFPTKGYSAPETDQVSARALELCRRVGDEDTLFTVLYARWALCHVGGRQKESAKLSDEYLRRGLAANAEIASMVGHRIRSAALTMVGDIETACQHGYEALKRYDEHQHQTLLARFGQDVKVASLCYLGLAEAVAGRADTALAHGQEAIGYARSLNHINGLGFALYHAGVLLPLILRRLETLQCYADELIELAQEHRLEFWEKGLLAAIYATAITRDVVAAERALTVSYHKFNSRLHAPIVLCHCVQIHLASGAIEEARCLLAETCGLIQQRGETYWEPEVYRLRGRLESLQGQNHYANAAEQFQQAIDYADRQGSKLLQLRAANDLARLWADQGERNRANNLLKPIYTGFTEGFGTVDLKEAKVLLDGLR